MAEISTRTDHPLVLEPQPTRPLEAVTSIVVTSEAVTSAVGPLLAELELLRGEPVLSIYFDDAALLHDDQMAPIYEHLRRMGKSERLSLCLHSAGGETVVAWKVVSLIREFCDVFSVLIPFYANSAATLIAVGADEIVMSPMSELSPTDPKEVRPIIPKREGGSQFEIGVQDWRHFLGFLHREVGSLSPDAAAQVFAGLFQKVHPVTIGAVERAYELAQQVCHNILSTHMDQDTEADQIGAIADYLINSLHDHEYSINRTEAKRVGLPVVEASDEESDLMWRLYTTYRDLGEDGIAVIGDEPVTATPVGYINSRAGSTVGVDVTSTADPDRSFIKWIEEWAE